MIEIAEEVATALREKRAVVALESSIIAHGLPHPQNIATAEMLEGAARAQGATPATIAIINGIARVGIDREMLEQLAAPGGGRAKCAIADLAALGGARASAGTTVSATAFLASRASIRVFATGGIGGVHRGDAGDVSSDLGALASLPIAVVSAGPKSVLDLPRTLERLETLGVLTVGYRTDELPAFYSRNSGLRLDHRIDEAKELAQLLRLRFDVLGQAGVLICNPIDADHEIPSTELAPVVAAATTEAEAQGIGGKALTPFLLGEIRRAFGDRAIECNQQLAQSNAELAARIAVSLAN